MEKPTTIRDKAADIAAATLFLGVDTLHNTIPEVMADPGRRRILLGAGAAALMLTAGGAGYVLGRMHG